MDNEVKFYNALNVALLSESSSYPKLRKLFDERGSWQKAWQSQNLKLDIDREWDKLAKNNVSLILADNQNFPPSLKEIPWPPFGIYIKGQLNNKTDKLAIVGTRKATATGLDFAEKISRELARLGITVVSGLALGIDEASHKGAVKVGGQTVAVLAVGLDKVYPASNANLAKKILETGGALISEYPLGTPSYPSHFIERNRLVSGLSRGVIVIEAPEKSGALATARFALEQNREVMVAPGPAGHPNYIGASRLIRDGASLVNSVEDILEDVGLKTSEASQSALNLDGLSPEQKLITLALNEAAAPLDAELLIQKTKLDISNLNRNITFLLVKGVIKERSGKYYL